MLIKRGGFRKTWKERLFYLDASEFTLSYFKNQEDKEKGRALKEIKLSDINSVSDIPKDMFDRSFAFQIVTDERIFYVQATTAEERRAWTTALTRAKELYMQALHQFVDALEQPSAELSMTNLLLKAVYEGDFHKVHAILNKSVDLTLCGPAGVTALHLSAVSGNKRIVTMLLNPPKPQIAPANVNQKDQEGFTPLHFCAWGKGIMEPVASSSFRTVTSALGVTASTSAAAQTDSDQIDILKMLLERGADVNAQSSQGIAPIHVAAFVGDDVFLGNLLMRGANINLQTDTGLTCLHICLSAKNGKWNEIASLLTSKGIVSTVKDRNGDTPTQNTPARQELIGNLKRACELLSSEGFAASFTAKRKTVRRATTSE
eukprot:TRINITY_DN8418_c0_g1_i1.p1 TRINITY_DN8418_c0_g1~~TRINITY_DN8418_c0_g1_i1.p1  ORF type:complete len:387 (+),score=100.91 TRINITY_DN8418_c0_g1_i1:42-1163(+)